MKRTIALLLSLLLVAVVMAGCGEKVISSGTTETTKVAETNAEAQGTGETVNYEAKSTDPLLSIKDIPEQDLDAADADYQNKAPEKGEEVAILHTNYGDISGPTIYLTQ